MNKKLVEFNQLTDAEQYFEFFNLPYDQAVVNVNRLHILRKFSNFVKERAADWAELSESETLDQYRIALQQAYSLFLTSNSLEQKLFKVFKEKPQNIVLLTELCTD